jgi:hypothetical protein
LDIGGPTVEVRRLKKTPKTKHKTPKNAKHQDPKTKLETPGTLIDADPR